MAAPENDYQGHVFRVRLDAEGRTAAQVEQALDRWAAQISVATGTDAGKCAQVIEMSESNPGWYHGRATLAPDLVAQGYPVETGII